MAFFIGGRYATQEEKRQKEIFVMGFLDRIGKLFGGDVAEFVTGKKETDAQRKARRSAEDAQAAITKQLEEQEAELAAISERATAAVAGERRRRAKRTGKASTILTSFDQNFGNTGSFKSTTGA